MANKNFVIFVVLSILVVSTWAWLAIFVYPPPPPAKKDDPVAKNEKKDEKKVNTPEKPKDEPKKKDEPPPKPQEEPVAATEVTIGGDADAAEPTLVMQEPSLAGVGAGQETEQ